MGMTVSGLSTGIDYASLIEQLKQVERVPINSMSSKKSAYELKNAAYTDLSSKLDALKSAADALRDAVDFGDRSNTVSDEDILTANSSTSATTGHYTLTVTELALSHKFISANGLSAEDATVASGSGEFTFKIGDSGTEYSVDVDSTTTLEEFKDSLNSLDQGLNAIIVSEGSGDTPYRLILSSEDTGADNMIIVTQDDTNLGFAVNDTDLSSTYHLQDPQDAEINMDGLDVTRDSNTITDLVPGTTLFLHKDAASTSVTLEVSEDRAGISSKISALVSKYNDVVGYINSRNDYDFEKNKGDPLYAEGTARSITTGLSGIISSAVSGLDDDMKSLAQLGISTNNDGTLELDTSELDDALDENLEKVTSLFIDDSSTEGIAEQIYQYAKSATQSGDGTIALRQKGLQDRISHYSDKITNMEAALERWEIRMVRQFTNLEKLISSMQSQDATFLQGI